MGGTRIARLAVLMGMSAIVARPESASNEHCKTAVGLDTERFETVYILRVHPRHKALVRADHTRQCVCYSDEDSPSNRRYCRYSPRPRTGVCWQIVAGRDSRTALLRPLSTYVACNGSPIASQDCVQLVRACVLRGGSAARHSVLLVAVRVERSVLVV